MSKDLRSNEWRVPVRQGSGTVRTIVRTVLCSTTTLTDRFVRCCILSIKRRESEGPLVGESTVVSTNHPSPLRDPSGVEFTWNCPLGRGFVVHSALIATVDLFFTGPLLQRWLRDQSWDWTFNKLDHVYTPPEVHDPLGGHYCRS